MLRRRAMRRKVGILIPISLFALAACGTVPTIGGRPLPAIGAEATGTTYRDLADIPNLPRVSPPEENQAAIEGLAAERSRTGEAAGELRRQPFTPPEPAPRVDF